MHDWKYKSACGVCGAKPGEWCVVRDSQGGTRKSSTPHDERGGDSLNLNQDYIDKHALGSERKIPSKDIRI